MAARDTGTEQLIKDTAKRIFFAEGRLHATTQDIADAAGVNRTLVNYYFRSKDILIEQVFKDAMNHLSDALDEVMNADLPFKKKIENLIDVFFKESVEYPYRETFLVTEIIGDAFKIHMENKVTKIKLFLAQIQEEMDAGNITPMNPIHFLFNLFSLMSYPLVMSPLFKQMYGLNDEEYITLLNERRKIIFELIFK